MPKLTAKLQRANETQSGPIPYTGLPRGARRGQALVEYALVIVAVTLTFLLAVAAILVQLGG